MNKATTQWFRNTDEYEARTLLTKAAISVQGVTVGAFGFVHAQVAIHDDPEIAIARLHQVGCFIDWYSGGKLQFRVFTDTPRGGKSPRDAA